MSKTRRESVQVFDNKANLKVASGSNPSKVAGAIVKYMDEGNDVFLLAMGAGAVSQAVKAIAIARGMAAPQGLDLYCVPAFIDEEIDGILKTVMKFYVKKMK